jgi:phosphoserine phosphatase RsbU/P
MRSQSTSKHAQPPRRRRTIAVISDVFSLSYPIHVLQGITDAAGARDINIIYAAGGPLGFAPNGDPMIRSSVFSLIGPENADGVIIIASLLNQYVSADEFTAFCAQYQPLPVVSVGLTLPGIPSIVIENYAGVYAEISHLIEVHGRRRIAFVRGPEGHEEAEERLRGYTEALAAHGLPLESELLAPGRFMKSSGEDAVTTLLDQRGVTFDALAAASDQMALGALEALERRGIRIPDEVALAGFDDLDQARWTSPPSPPCASRTI